VLLCLLVKEEEVHVITGFAETDICVDDNLGPRFLKEIKNKGRQVYKDFFEKGQYVSHTVRPLMMLLVLPTLTLMMVGDSIHEGLRSNTSD